MKTWLQLEEAAGILLSIYLFSSLPFAWWVYMLLFFAPDLALIAIAAEPRAGALVYNLFHHKGLAIGFFVLGMWLNLATVALAGVILLGHASFDRLLGLGLKDGETFTHAHLGLFGIIVKPARKQEAHD
jgi:hypothetical protein